MDQRWLKHSEKRYNSKMISVLAYLGRVDGDCYGHK